MSLNQDQTVEQLSHQHVDDFFDQGFIVLKGVLSREEADGFRQKIIDMVPPSIPDTADNFTFLDSELQVGAVYYLTDVQPKGGGLFAVPGSHKLVREQCEASERGRHLQNGWVGIGGFPPPIEVLGEAGDVILTHYLLAHGASHNRRVRTRVAYFTRYSCLDQPFYPPPAPSVDRFNTRQVAAMGPIGRKLMGVDAWD